MTANWTIGKLATLVREYELQQAPGSETSLLGDFCERMRQLGAHPTLQGCLASEVEITSEEAQWWLDAYAKQATAGA